MTVVYLAGIEGGGTAEASDVAALHGPPVTRAPGDLGRFFSGSRATSSNGSKLFICPELRNATQNSKVPY